MSIQSTTKPTEAKLSFSLSLPLIIGVVLISLTMRSPLTSVGPLVGSIRESLGLSNTAAGLLTTLPLLAFSLLSPFAPILARRFGMERIILYALVLLMAGIAIRSLSATVPLFAGTVLLGLAIAVCNVLIPSLVKRDFSHNVGFMTGLYSVSMNLCGAIASGVSVPLARSLGIGWNGALGIWGLLALIAALFWFPKVRASHASAKITTSGASARRSLWRSPLAWIITLFMGLQSLLFYVLIAWLPEVMTSRSLNEDSAGWMLSLFQFASLPVSFIVPIVAGRMKNQRLLVVIMTVLFFVSLGGLYFGDNALILLWTILLGIAGGCAFSLAMIFLSLRTKDATDAASLSGMSQSVGYLLAATGPTLFGLLHDVTASWNLPILLLLMVSILLFIFGLGASKNQTV
ncbi:MFS transporter [Bacillus licheniformis]|jgi:CP family cyanate transporter-like MFS transporter|uniref:CynX/NimT family MFS transporter n=1 Tax=Bacillus TaxID=1386 RepID=UPI0008BFC13B|nr:MFS transporter [Bacillus licheniformis]HWO96068.1 MFS transporter [Bacillus sp. (in: firmicutes)]MBK4209402.1 MFS transporter [Bacillus licheniformis]MBT1251283.1 MFS transporter [Bacillus licheniformis]MBY8833339.1 MFS transporter [Bacillus licheniformis]MCY7775986.1 MFS transporter [Bacillus licheniformis]